jgi:glucose/arabinose dehydrogenase
MLRPPRSLSRPSFALTSVSAIRRVGVAAAAVAALSTLVACGSDGAQPATAPSSPATAGESSATASGSAGPAEMTSPEVTATIATRLEVPWGIDFLPGGDAVVTERDSGGVLRISEDDHAIAELGSIAEASPNGEGGLLGVAVSPSYTRDRTLFFYLSAEADNRVVRATVTRGQLSEPEPLLTGIPLNSYHDGGRIAFGPDGYLYVATGDAGDGELAQDPDSLSGKILRITPDGEPAPGNPSGSPVWSPGHRNVQGLAWIGDQLWASEFGENTYDELNRIEPGGNYGWPEVEGRGGEDRGFIDPVAQWSTSEASPSGLAAANGSLWMAALRGERLWQINPDSGETTEHLTGEYGRLRTIVPAPDGTLWVTTSNRDGRGSPAEQDDRILQITLPPQ